MIRCFYVALLLLLLSGCAHNQRVAPGPASVAAAKDWGPFYSQHRDLAGIERTRAAGPIFEKASSQAGDEFLAVRPFYSRTHDAKKEKELHEFLWPLGAYKKYANDARWWFLVYFGWMYDLDKPEAERVHKRWVLPFWFSGRNQDGKDYAAVFPIWGTMHDFLGRDEVSWAFFPIYFRNRINDVQAESWFWPVYSHTKGEGVERFRVFPFYGWSQWREDWRRTFIMWPFYNQATFTFEDAPGSAWMLWPLYGEVRSPSENKVVRWVLPPFFRFETGGETQKNFFAWPFFQSQEGPNFKKLYLFPLYGHKTIGTTKSKFWLWPVFHHFISEYKHLERRRLLALPFWHQDILENRETGEVDEAKYKLWPLFSYRREQQAVRMRLLDLWLLHQTPAIERNYSPLWTLAKRESVGEASDTEVLWGTYRNLKYAEDDQFTSLFPLFDRTRLPSGDRSWNILKGLVGREVHNDEATWRLLWLMRFAGGSGGDEGGSP